MTKPRLIDRDTGWSAIMRRVHDGAATQPTVKVGIVGSKAEDVRTIEAGDPLTNAQLGAVHEFGSAGVPERSFLRATVDREERTYRGELRRLGRAVTRGRISARDALEAFGLHVVGDVKATIQAGIAPPLSDETLRRKTVGGKVGTTPLIDTGQLIGAITSEVQP